MPTLADGLSWTDGTNLYAPGESYRTQAQNVSYTTVAVSPILSNKNSIRTAAPAGIRFGGFMTEAMLSAADEIGFIVARGDLLDDKNFDAAQEVKIAGNVTEKPDGSFTGKTANGITLVGAKSYVKGRVNKTVNSPDGKTPFGDYNEQGAYFTGVVINLDKGYTKNGVTYANRYDVSLVARAYVKIGSSYFYSDCSAKSLKEAAMNIRDTDSETYAANKAYIDEIIANAGKTE